MDTSGWLRKQLETASPELLRAMVQDFAEALMGVEADALCGAAYGERSPERINRSNGYRERDWDTRAGTIELAVPKLREGSYFPTGCRRRSASSNQRIGGSNPPGRTRKRQVGLSLARMSSVTRRRVWRIKPPCALVGRDARDAQPLSSRVCRSDQAEQ